MARFPITRGRLPHGGVSEPLAGFSTANLRDVMLNKMVDDLETRSFGTANLRTALQATGGNSSSQQSSGQQSGQQKPVEPGKK